MGPSHLKKLLSKQKGVQRISSITDKCGHLCYSPTEIAEVFATFYEELYNDHIWLSIQTGTGSLAISPVSVEEVAIAAKRLKNPKL